MLSEFAGVDREVRGEGFSQLPIDWDEVQSNRLAGESASAGMVSLKAKGFLPMKLRSIFFFLGFVILFLCLC
jgi:hypothetical protein